MTSFRWHVVIRFLPAALALPYIVLGLLIYWPDAFWLFETLSNLRVQFAWIGVGLAAVLLAFRWKFLSAVVVFCVAMHAAFAIQFRLPAADATDQQPNLRVTVANIGLSRDERELIHILASEKPDVLLLIEDFTDVRARLAEQAGIGPYHAETGIDLRGVSVHSRFPVMDASVESRDYTSHILSVRVSLQVTDGQQDILFLAAHPNSPVLPWRSVHRRRALEHLAELSAEQSMPVILAGDLNLTAQSHLFADLLEDGGLRDTAVERRPKPTWHATALGPSLRLDHILVSEGVKVAERRVSSGFGSDHRALTVDIVLPQ